VATVSLPGRSAPMSVGCALDFRLLRSRGTCNQHIPQGLRLSEVKILSVGLKWDSDFTPVSMESTTYLSHEIHFSQRSRKTRTPSATTIIAY
jgi:hypothetical protein